MASKRFTAANRSNAVLPNPNAGLGKSARYAGSKAKSFAADNIGANPTGFVLAAGAVTFLGNMKQTGGIPDNAVQVVTATIILAIGASFTKGTAFAEPVKWLAILMLLAAVLKQVPRFSSKSTAKRKAK